MKYANFSTLGRTSVNIGDYLQFMATDYLFSLMGIDVEQVVRIGFDEVETYDGEEVILPCCYTFIYFVKSGRISISEKIRPIFLAVTLSTVDQFMDLDEFFKNDYNYIYFLKHAPIGCRDEFTYNLFKKYGIPAYINGCMTAVFPKYSGPFGNKVFFVDAPKSLIPFIPDDLLDKCEFSKQQYYFNESDIKDYHKIFRFVSSKYSYYKQNARMAVTSRLHVALPLTAFGIPVILAKDNVDGRFSFIENYLPVYSRENYDKINWTFTAPDFEGEKKLLISHALGRIENNVCQTELANIEQNLTKSFKSRTITCEYKDSHMITHRNAERFDTYAAEFWNPGKPVKYAFWGANENNAEFWKNYIETKYPYAELVAVFDSFKEGEIFGLPYQPPREIVNYSDISIIVCSVGAVEAAFTLFKNINIDASRYCITSDCFITSNDIEERKVHL